MFAGHGSHIDAHSTSFFFFKVWAQLSTGAQRRLIQAGIVFMEDQKVKGPTAVVNSRWARKGRKDMDHTTSIHAVGQGVPTRTVFY